MKLKVSFIEKNGKTAKNAIILPEEVTERIAEVFDIEPDHQGLGQFRIRIEESKRTSVAEFIDEIAFDDAYAGLMTSLNMISMKILHGLDVMIDIIEETETSRI